MAPGAAARPLPEVPLTVASRRQRRSAPAARPPASGLAPGSSETPAPGAYLRDKNGTGERGRRWAAETLLETTRRGRRRRCFSNRRFQCVQTELR